MWSCHELRRTGGAGVLGKDQGLSCGYAEFQIPGDVQVEMFKSVNLEFRARGPVGL